MTISFDITREEAAAIERIIARATVLRLFREGHDRLAVFMDLAATHANGCPMDFERMLAADDFNFTHDYCGIARYIDRETGQLTECFLPRFAKPEA
jgi:hypothetical protein